MRPGSLLLVVVALVVVGGEGAAAQQGDTVSDALVREAVERLTEYLRIDTSNPPGNELAAARWLRSVLAREGIEGQILDTAELGPGRANFYARLAGTGHGARAIALVHHMDVVPVTRENWSVDPFGGVVKDGYVYGRGALDMKGHGVIQLMSLIALKRSGVPLARDVVFIANADEEVNDRGADRFVARHRELLRGVDYVVTEGGGAQVEGGAVKFVTIGVGEKRAYWQRLTVRGVASHGSVPTADNPVPRLARAVARLGAWETPVHLTPAVERMLQLMAAAETGERRAWLTNPRAALRTGRGRAWLLSNPARNALLRNTVTPTVLAGANKTNIIPQVASAEIDVRLLPDQDTLGFRREMLRVIGDPAVTVTTIGSLAPRYDAPFDTEMFRVLRRAFQRMAPAAPVGPGVDAGASDRPFYARAGIIAYGTDPYLVEDADARRGVHGNDERLSVENVRQGIGFYLRILRAVE